MSPTPFDRDSVLLLTCSHFMEMSKKDFPSHGYINFSFLTFPSLRSQMGMCCKPHSEKSVGWGLCRGACSPLPVLVLMSALLTCIVKTPDEPDSDP